MEACTVACREASKVAHMATSRNSALLDIGNQQYMFVVEGQQHYSNSMGMPFDSGQLSPCGRMQPLCDRGSAQWLQNQQKSIAEWPPNKMYIS